MNEENTTIMPPEKQIVQDDRDARAEELESAFSYDGYQVVRKELFAHLRDPAIVIRKDSITFNTACITGLEDVVYVHVMFNNDLKRIVVRGCDENDKDALRWCVAKPDKRKSRKMSCKPFATLVYQKMGWDSECRYKMLGYRITCEGETLYVFDLKNVCTDSICQIFSNFCGDTAGGKIGDKSFAHDNALPLDNFV